MAKKKAEQADTSHWSDATESGRVTEAVPPEVPVSYPRVLYRHDRLDRVTVENEDAEKALGDGWFPAPPAA